MGSKKLPGRFLNCDSRLSATDGYFFEALACRNSSLLPANSAEHLPKSNCRLLRRRRRRRPRRLRRHLCRWRRRWMRRRRRGSSDGGGGSGGGMLATGGTAATSAGGGCEGKDGGGGGIGGGGRLAVSAAPARTTVRGRQGRADGRLCAAVCGRPECCAMPVTGSRAVCWLCWPAAGKEINLSSLLLRRLLHV